MYIKRTIENTIKKVSNSFPCIVINGPRQVGKATTANFIFGGKFNYVTLDSFESRNLAINNPELFLNVYSGPLLIDEIQKAPKLLDEIKEVIDRKKLDWLKTNNQRELLYVLTGSNKFELKNVISESLAGRAGGNNYVLTFTE